MIKEKFMVEYKTMLCQLWSMEFHYISKLAMYIKQ